MYFGRFLEVLDSLLGIFDLKWANKFLFCFVLFESSLMTKIMFIFC